MAVFPRRKVNHDFTVDGGLEVTGNTTLAALKVTGNTTVGGDMTITGALTQTGVATFTAAPVLSAGLTNTAQKSGIILSTGGYVAEHVQSLTDSAALTDTGGSSKALFTAILGYGVTKITVTGTSGTAAGQSTANDLVFKLNTPVAVGVHKFIFVSGASASTKEVKVRTASSLQTFLGSTYNSFVWSTAVNNPADALHLIGITTNTSVSAWAIVNRKYSTAGSLAGATA